MWRNIPEESHNKPLGSTKVAEFLEHLNAYSVPHLADI
jgi:hypothetical protein